MSRLARERLFFKAGSVQYKRLVEQSRRVEADTTDNLMKMALHIVKQAKPEKLAAEYATLAGSQPFVDLEEGSISERVPQAKAVQLLEEWKKILVQFEKDGGNIDSLFAGGEGTGE